MDALYKTGNLDNLCVSYTFNVNFYVDRKKFCMLMNTDYCLTKISIRAKRSISRVFSLFIVLSPFSYIVRTKAVLTGLKLYQTRFMASVTVSKNRQKIEILVRQ